MSRPAETEPDTCSSCASKDENQQARRGHAKGGKLEDARFREARDRAWDNSPDLLCVVEADGTFSMLNPAWTFLLGWQAGELSGRDHLFVSHPDDRLAGSTSLARAMAGQTHVYECRVRHRDGSYRIFSWTNANDGERVYASGRDITAERQVGSALAKADAQFRRSEKMEAIGQLTGGIAHEFNNLLQVLAGGLERLERRHVTTDEGRRLVRQSEHAISRGVTLTRHLLAFAGKQQLASKAIDINSALRASADFFGSSLVEGAAITWQLGRDTWPAMADPEQLEVAVFNLLQNAREATPATGSIIVETANAPGMAALPGELEAGDYVVLSVTDTGAGMAEDLRARAVEPFFTTKGLGEGTGLGLSQVYGFARQSGGAAHIVSEPGRGTTVRVMLPCATAVTREPAAPPHATAAQGGETILVIDDDGDVRELAVAALEDCSYRVLQADSGLHGLAILFREKVDLLLVDFAMQGMNGAEVVRLARQERPSLKVVFMTGYADVDSLVAFTAAEDILRKPFRLTTLTTHVATVLGR